MTRLAKVGQRLARERPFSDGAEDDVVWEVIVDLATLLARESGRVTRLVRERGKPMSPEQVFACVLSEPDP